jgi:hypothetical protein
VLAALFLDLDLLGLQLLEFLVEFVAPRELLVPERPEVIQRRLDVRGGDVAPAGPAGDPVRVGNESVGDVAVAGIERLGQLGAAVLEEILVELDDRPQLVDRRVDLLDPAADRTHLLVDRIDLRVGDLRVGL